MTEFYDDPRGRIARDRMLGMIRGELGHESFTANSLLDLLSLIELGAANMVAEDQLEPADLDRADQATLGLLRKLYEVRLELGSPAFTEESVSTARFQLCPGFWPFC